MGIKAKFCPVCGKEKGKFVDKVCVDCYFKTVEIEVPKSIILQACPICDSIRVKGFWIKASEDHESFLVQAIVEKLKLPAEVELEDIEILQEGKEGSIQINLDVAGQRFSVAKAIGLYFSDRLCDDDSKRRREVHEGILQLRTEKDVHRFVSMALNVLKEYANNILKMEELRNGADVYFIDKETMNHAVSQLKRKFNLYVKVSAKAYSWEKTKSRPKFKLTILAKQR
ncbi:MAG TPA: NMD3-related protein [Candidatus Nanoarchaeia archaeon]|nr:NMD3-related protein [Candidatus Nanoarchaeia archaeon]